jgi:hypothetical protein
LTPRQPSSSISTARQGAIAEIEVESASILSNAHIDRTLFSVKQRSRLEQLRRGA